MTQEDKQEIKEIIQLTMSGYNARVDANYDIINNKLDGIYSHLKRLNGKVAKHESQIQKHNIDISKIPDPQIIHEIQENQSNNKYFWRTLAVIVATLAASVTIILSITKIVGIT